MKTIQHLTPKRSPGGHLIPIIHLVINLVGVWGGVALFLFLSLYKTQP